MRTRRSVLRSRFDTCEEVARSTAFPSQLTVKFIGSAMRSVKLVLTQCCEFSGSEKSTVNYVIWKNRTHRQLGLLTGEPGTRATAAQESSAQKLLTSFSWKERPAKG